MKLIRFLFGFVAALIRRSDITNHTESALNLTNPFFPARATSVDEVKELLAKLHPVCFGNRLIRMGPDGDGGYLVPDDLDGIVACFSPGVSTVCGFETDCAKLGMKVFMADASVEKPPTDNPAFRFIPKFIGAKTSGQFISLKDWVDTRAEDGDLLLQMDIEGWEYETLLATPSELLSRFRIIVIEFHTLDMLFCAPVFQFYRQVFEKLLRAHTCVHIHPNNCCPTIKVQGEEFLQMGEFTFLRNDRVDHRGHSGSFPHPLDKDNVGGKSVKLPQSFYRTPERFVNDPASRTWRT